MGFPGFFCLYAMRVNLSVAIVAMVSKLRYFLRYRELMKIFSLGSTTKFIEINQLKLAQLKRQIIKTTRGSWRFICFNLLKIDMNLFQYDSNYDFQWDPAMKKDLCFRSIFLWIYYYSNVSEI